VIERNPHRQELPAFNCQLSFLKEEKTKIEAEIRHMLTQYSLMNFHFKLEQDSVRTK